MGRNNKDFEESTQIHSMDPKEFSSTFKPSEYANEWSDVTTHPEYDRDEDGNKAHHELVADLTKNGMHSAVYVKTPENIVQDGHHRVAAALEAGVPIKYTKSDEDKWAGNISDYL